MDCTIGANTVIVSKLYKMFTGRSVDRRIRLLGVSNPPNERGLMLCVSPYSSDGNGLLRLLWIILK